MLEAVPCRIQDVERIESARGMFRNFEYEDDQAKVIFQQTEGCPAIAWLYDKRGSAETLVSVRQHYKGMSDDQCEMVMRAIMEVHETAPGLAHHLTNTVMGQI